MIFWAAVSTLIMGAFAYLGDPSSILMSAAEIVGVIALFMLICAAEAFSIPKNPSFDKGQAQPES
jgi:hypothetical protein